MADEWIGLADAIEFLRRDLLAAAEAGRGSELQFELAPVELTVQAVVKRDASGKVGWKILEAGASLGTEKTQAVSLVLNPVRINPDGTSSHGFLVSAASGVEPRFD